MQRQVAGLARIIAALCDKLDVAMTKPRSHRSKKCQPARSWPERENRSAASRSVLRAAHIYCASGFFSTRSITAVSTVPTTSATR
jgi:hypothetical protein